VPRPIRLEANIFRLSDRSHSRSRGVDIMIGRATMWRSPSFEADKKLRPVRGSGKHRPAAIGDGANVTIFLREKPDAP